jgi:hypothetical protein
MTKKFPAEIKNVFYTQFDYFEGGYVAYGHPTIETHIKNGGSNNSINRTIESFCSINLGIK